MKTNALLIGLALFAIGNGCFAQDEKIISLENYRMKKRRSSIWDKTVETTNESVIKFNTLQLMRGEIAFAFESAINERTSFEIELGPTLSQLKAVSSGHTYPYVDQYNPIQPNVSAQSMVGVHVSGAVRYYPMDEDRVTQGFYISPVFKYRLYNQMYHDESGLLTDQQGSKGQARFSFVFGKQLWFSQRFSMDMYIGTGINHQVESESLVFANFDNNGNVTYNWKNSTIRENLWFITGGIRVGIGW